MSGSHSESNKLFQIVGPATDCTTAITEPSICCRNSERVQWASRVCDQLTVVGLVRKSLTSQRLVDDSGLLSTRCFTGSQCRLQRTGEVLSRQLAPVRKHSAPFWIDCRHLPEQTVTDAAVEQSVTETRMAGYERVDLCFGRFT